MVEDNQHARGDGPAAIQGMLQIETALSSYLGENGKIGLVVTMGGIKVAGTEPIFDTPEEAKAAAQELIPAITAATDKLTARLGGIQMPPTSDHEITNN